MKVLLSWLNEFGPFADPTDVDAVEAVAADLTALGLAVEEVISTGSPVAGVVAAQVLRVEQHPDAAKVRRVWVDAGDGEERHVWCGASNMVAGDVVPLATLGTTMPNGMTIERRGILGIDSEGMLCSAVELGIGEDHSGILLLDSDAELGVSYAEVLGIKPDVIFDLDLTRNRPDCWSIAGVARDLAAWRSQPLAEVGGGFAANGEGRSVPVSIHSPACGRFTATVMSGVRVGSSPDWMARRLEALGMRSINNVVDVSNYVMLELGQPNHAYDLATIGGGFSVRSARDGEKLTTLDDVERACVAVVEIHLSRLDTVQGIALCRCGLDL